MIGRDAGAKGAKCVQYIMETMQEPTVAERWNAYIEQEIISHLQDRKFADWQKIIF